MSGKQVQKYIPNVLKYSELETMSNSEIADIIPFVCLYEIEEDYGHWCLLTNTAEGVEFFDSYSFLPDQQRDFIDKNFKMISGQSRPRILEFLNDLSLSVPINYMDQQLQGANTNTCGRWCCLRHMMRHLSVDDFLAEILHMCKILGTFPDMLTTLLIPPEEHR